MAENHHGFDRQSGLLGPLDREVDRAANVLDRAGKTATGSHGPVGGVHCHQPGLSQKLRQRGQPRSISALPRSARYQHDDHRRRDPSGKIEIGGRPGR